MTSRSEYVDHVTPDLRRRVFYRDGMCTAAKLGAGSICADNWGRAVMAHNLSVMELAHVKDEPRMGKRATSDEWHAVTCCPGHHRGAGTTRAWLDQNADVVREYLAIMRRRATGSTEAIEQPDDDEPYDALPW